MQKGHHTLNWAMHHIGYQWCTSNWVICHIGQWITLGCASNWSNWLSMLMGTHIWCLSTKRPPHVKLDHTSNWPCITFGFTWHWFSGVMGTHTSHWAPMVVGAHTSHWAHIALVSNGSGDPHITLSHASYWTIHHIEPHFTFITCRGISHTPITTKAEAIPQGWQLSSLIFMSPSYNVL